MFGFSKEDKILNNRTPHKKSVDTTPQRSTPKRAFIGKRLASSDEEGRTGRGSSRGGRRRRKEYGLSLPITGN